MTFVEALAAFNRKERYWLLLNALGSGALVLDDGFRERLGAEVRMSIPHDAWWAMDYHLDWLVGALHLTGQDKAARSVQINEDSLVQGNQEDIDLVVAFDETLILVEAKGDTSWGNSQIHSKLRRLNAIIGRQTRSGGFVPTVRLVLMSPRSSEGLRPPEGESWPSWMLKGEDKPYRIDLSMRLDGDRLAEGKTAFRRIVRCVDDTGTVGKAGSHWTVV